MNEENEINYLLNPIERLEKYILSNSISHQYHCTKCIIECLEICDIIYLKTKLMNFIEILLQSPHLKIIESILGKISDFSDLICDKFPDEALNLIIDYLIPILQCYLSTCTSEFIDLAAESYSSVITLLDPNDFVLIQFPYLKSLSLSPRRDSRILSATILSCLIYYFEPELMFLNFIEIINILSSDDIGTIRLIIPQLISLYSKKLKLPKEQSQLSGRFHLFCRDPALCVRKSAAESLITLSESLDDNNRLLIIIPSILTLLNDSSEEIIILMKQNLGALISTFGPNVDNFLVSIFCNSISDTNQDISYPSAYSFPAVALALGKSRWNELASTFEIAINSKNEKIRRTLSFGLVSYAHLLDSIELEDTIIYFLRDLPLVAIGIISNLHQFLPLINQKENLLFCLKNPNIKYNNWRIRFKVSEQIRYCSEDFDRLTLFQIAQDLIKDDVAIVRKDALLSFSHLIRNSEIEIIKDLIFNQNHFLRWCAASLYSYLDPSISINILNFLIKLSNDHVQNVRISLAMSLNSLKEIFLNNDFILKAISILKNDKDLDVNKIINQSLF